jgi:hydrogenase/urease accessory protein HupE
MLIVDASGFAAGFVHPLLAPAHLLSLVGLTLLVGGAVIRFDTMPSAPSLQA